MSDTNHTIHALSSRVWTRYESPLGPLTLVASPRGLTALSFAGHSALLEEHDRRPEAFSDAVAQLDEYFNGERTGFALTLDLDRGTPSQQRVWEQLLQIPYATTTSYTQLAQAIGRPDRVRAVAAAVGRTPIPIIVPCHRAVAADGALTGYLGGLQRKRALLDLEARAACDLRIEPVLHQLTLI